VSGKSSQERLEKNKKTQISTVSLLKDFHGSGRREGREAEVEKFRHCWIGHKLNLRDDQNSAKVGEAARLRDGSSPLDVTAAQHARDRGKDHRAKRLESEGEKNAAAFF